MKEAIQQAVFLRQHAGHKQLRVGNDSTKLIVHDLRYPGRFRFGGRTSHRFYPGIPGSLNDYDPKVIYDPMEDRFVLIFLLGNAPPSTYIVTCFPETSDPTGDWNVYFLDGDPFSTGHWSDYPAIALSEEELFITINLLVPGDPGKLLSTRR